MGILLLDLQDRITGCKHTLQRMLGYAEANLKGMHMAELVMPEDVAVEFPYRDAMVSGSVNHYAVELRLVRHDSARVGQRRRLGNTQPGRRIIVSHRDG